MDFNQEKAAFRVQCVMLLIILTLVVLGMVISSDSRHVMPEYTSEIAEPIYTVDGNNV